MKERPILFSGPMVRAILDGRKTQTRRVVKPQPEKSPSRKYEWKWSTKPNHSTSWNGRVRIDCPHCSMWTTNCPYGTVGDRLWVRESWAPASAALPHKPSVLYRADYHTGLEKKNGDQTWKPSIHMRREDSRLTLEITGIRVERVQEITPKDAIAEGFMPTRESGLGTSENFRKAAELVGGPYPRGLFAMTWNQINGPDSWSANPWVWVVEFKRIKP